MLCIYLKARAEIQQALNLLSQLSQPVRVLIQVNLTPCEMA